MKASHHLTGRNSSCLCWKTSRSFRFCKCGEVCSLTQACDQMKTPTRIDTHTHTHSQGPRVWHPVECVFLRSSLKRWFSLISRSPWPSPISLIFSSCSFSPPLALPLGYHHLLYLFSIPELALLSLHPSTLLFLPLYLCLSPSLFLSSFHSRSIFSFLSFLIYHTQAEGKGEA